MYPAALMLSESFISFFGQNWIHSSQPLHSSWLISILPFICYLHSVDPSGITGSIMLLYTHAHTWRMGPDNHVPVEYFFAWSDIYVKRNVVWGLKMRHRESGYLRPSFSHQLFMGEKKRGRWGAGNSVLFCFQDTGRLLVNLFIRFKCRYRVEFNVAHFILFALGVFLVPFCLDD